MAKSHQGLKFKHTPSVEVYVDQTTSEGLDDHVHCQSHLGAHLMHKQSGNTSGSDQLYRIATLDMCFKVQTV